MERDSTVVWPGGPTSAIPFEPLLFIGELPDRVRALFELIG